ncbi:hypothetical protein CIPAW_11G002900 [Carya illinoinensis]|uniref:Uncharacterized protein n=1 Tax=Carya illinoinensis TaxID=32201 RepID=A0A8T1NZ25_CARIL|nr:hypothetical protein CIPAW_11G002900 [Carya illinoinensis]
MMRLGFKRYLSFLVFTILLASNMSAAGEKMVIGNNNKYVQDREGFPRTVSLVAVHLEVYAPHGPASRRVAPSPPPPPRGPGQQHP